MQLYFDFSLAEKCCCAENKCWQAEFGPELAAKCIPELSFQKRLDIGNRSSANSFGLILNGNSVWISPSSDWFELIWIENLVSDWFRFIRIDVSELIGSSRIDFRPFFIKRDTKCFSDWFEMIRIGSDTDIGMNRNSSDWLRMNFNPILSPGWLTRDFTQMKRSLSEQTLILSIWAPITIKKGSCF